MPRLVSHIEDVVVHDKAVWQVWPRRIAPCVAAAEVGARGLLRGVGYNVVAGRVARAAVEIDATVANVVEQVSLQSLAAHLSERDRTSFVR